VETGDCQRELEVLASMPDHLVRPSPLVAEGTGEMRSLQDAMMRYLADQGAVIECCPTSNERIASLSHDRPHPIRRFLDSGLTVTIGRDDPGIFDCSLETERDRLAFSGVNELELARIAESTASLRSRALLREGS
jgi:adenosine deaminase